MIKQTSNTSNSTISNPHKKEKKNEEEKKKRFRRALTTYNNPPLFTNRGIPPPSNAKPTRVDRSCKDVWSCEALLDGEKGVQYTNCDSQKHTHTHSHRTRNTRQRLVLKKKRKVTRRKTPILKSFPPPFPLT